MVPTLTALLAFAACLCAPSLALAADESGLGGAWASVDAVIADTVTVKRILPNIITKMNLPVMGPDGQPMSYSLDHKEGGKRLREDETLIHAGVGDGDHLIVYPEIVAG